MDVTIFMDQKVLSITDLPQDVWFCICEFLKKHSIAKLSRVNLEIKFSMELIKSVRFKEIHAAYRYTNIKDKHIKIMPYITNLDCSGRTKFLSSKKLSTLSNLKKLHLSNFNITDKDLSKLTNIESLSLTAVPITFDSVKKLSNLRALTLSYETFLTPSNLKNLTNLTKLTLNEAELSSDTYLRALINLTSLNINRPGRKCGEGLRTLTNLKTLSLDFNYYVRDSHMSHLTSLTSLSICSDEGGGVHGKGFKNMNLLERLYLSRNDLVAGKYVSDKTNLKVLVLNRNSKIRPSAIKNLTNLTKLDISKSLISKENTSHLLNLVDLITEL